MARPKNVPQQVKALKDMGLVTKKIVKGVAVKKRRNRPGTNALREIRRFQKSIDLLLPKLPFKRLVKELTAEATNTDIRWRKEAILALQEATEMYVTDILQSAYDDTIHRDRVMLVEKDLHKAVKDDAKYRARYMNQ